MTVFHLVLRRVVAALLAVLLAVPAATAKPGNPASIKEQILNIRSGSSVEVRLTDKSKLQGRLGEVSDSGFELQGLSGDKIGTQQVPFDRVQSVRDKSQASMGRSLGHGFIIAGVVIVAIVVIYFVACQGVCGG